MILSRELSIPLEGAFVLGTAVQFIVMLLAVAYATLSIAQKKWRRVAGAGLVAVLLIAAWLPVAGWIRIHTGFGVAAMGGGKHWMRQAAETSDPVAAELIARNVVESSLKGVHAADWGAQSIRDRRKRRRAFLLLKQVVPPESPWREIFQRSADQAVSGTHSH